MKNILIVLFVFILTGCSGTLALLQDDPKEVQECLELAGDVAEASYKACESNVEACVLLASDAAEDAYRACVAEKLS